MYLLPRICACDASSSKMGRVARRDRRVSEFSLLAGSASPGGTAWLLLLGGATAVDVRGLHKEPKIITNYLLGMQFQQHHSHAEWELGQHCHCGWMHELTHGWRWYSLHGYDRVLAEA